MKTWTIDTAHSEIAFKVKHLMIATVRGTFGVFEGSATAEDDTFANAAITFSADIASISTKNAQRDGHLVSPDFFDAVAFPKLTFVSTSVIATGSDLEIAGNLTIKGVTKPIALKAMFNGIGTGMDGKRVAGFDIVGTLNRNDFGLTWNAPLEAGGVVVSETVNLEVSIEAKEA